MKKNRFNPIMVTCLLLLFSMTVQAQKSKIGTWKTYLAYQEAILTTETPNHVFAVYKGAYNDGKTYNDGVLLSFSKEDNEIATYSFNEGLNDMGIVQMGYCSETKVLVLVYSNANIDLFLGKNDVFNISSMKDKGLTNKNINSLEIIGKYAYISTGFGIVVVDTERREIKTECKLNTDTKAVCQWGDYLYAATTEGIIRAPISSNLMDRENWKPFDELKYDGNKSRIEKMAIFKDQLIFYDGSYGICRATKEGQVTSLFQGMCRQITVLNEQLILCLYNVIYFYTDFDKRETTAEITAASITSYNSKDTYWIARPMVSWDDLSQTGLLSIRKETGSNGHSVLKSAIKVDSPLRNHCFALTYTADKLLVTGGSVNTGISGTFMIYENGKWTNFDDRAIAKKTGLNYDGAPWCRDFISAVVDPRDSHHYFVGSFVEGVYEFQDTTFIKLHTYTNTDGALQTILPNNRYPQFYVRAAGLAYDRNSNLYVVSTEIQNVLSVLTNDNKWKSFYYSDMVEAWAYQILITRKNLKWITKYRGSSVSTIGIWVLDDNNTIDDPTDDTAYFSRTFKDQQERVINAQTYSCIAEDLDGTIWVGTDVGPITFTSPSQVAAGICNRIVSTDQQNEGFYIMENRFVTAIAVDGGNRKWIGTKGDGIFIVDNSGGTWTTKNFNTRNSNLISDNITAIAINNKTGEVFIGTDKGLVSYMGDAIEGASDYSKVYAYPNPVKPGSNNLVTVTGLVSNSTIKITDVAGNLINQGISIGGQYTWNCTNFSGAIVKAGIYLVFATLPDGSRGVATKIMVIK
jgi:hypothetical protein